MSRIVLWLILGLFIFKAAKWGIIDATWQADTQSDCNPKGACWAMIHARIDQFIYGFYPLTQRWRVNLSFLLLMMLLLINYFLKMPFHLRALLVLITLLAIFFIQAYPTDLWGGLFLTILLAFSSIICSFPIALLLALGRNGSFPFVKAFCVTVIELIRGVPLISILFMAAVMLPLFLPPGMTLDKLFCALIGLILFQAAYLAEVIRGGLNSIPRSQLEAAHALGLNYYQRMYYVVLPQALRAVVPGMMNNFIAALKDTTLVLIIGLYDFLGIVQSASTDPKWIGTSFEAYIFCALVYFTCCFTLSHYGTKYETNPRI